jgi:DegV family protein with EDD domain
LSGARPRVRIVTGSSTCLDATQARELGITLVPLRIHLEGGERRDLSDISPSEVYTLLRAGARITTSSATPGDYLDAFQAEPGPVLCLTEGSGFSAGNGSARVAAGLAGDQEIEVVDSGTAAGGLRLLALAAARWAAEGLAVPEMAERLAPIRERVEMVGMLETVEYLGRSGRIPELASWGGSVLRVRPVIRFKDGKGSLATLVRSPMKGLAELHRQVLRLAAAQRAGPRGEGLCCTVFHADALQLAEELRDRIRHDMPLADLTVTEMTPAMGVHTGPGVVAHAAYVAPLAD